MILKISVELSKIVISVKKDRFNDNMAEAFDMIQSGIVTGVFDCSHQDNTPM